jgi:hypothetical protein
MKRCFLPVPILLTAALAVGLSVSGPAAATPGPVTTLAAPPSSPGTAPSTPLSPAATKISVPVTRAPAKVGAAPTSPDCTTAKSAAAAESAAAAAGKSTYTCITPTNAPAGLSVRTMAGTTAPSSSNTTPDGLAPDPSPGSWPIYCDNAIGHTFYLDDRYNECKVSYVELTVYEVPSGKTLGTGEVQFIEWDQVAHSRQSWVHWVDANLYTATGVVTGGEQIYTRLACSAGCSVTPSPADQWQSLRLNQPLQGQYTITSATNAVSYYAARLDTWYWNSAAPASEPYLGLSQVPDWRCDHASYLNGGGGCVFYESGPVFNINESDPTVGKSALFIYSNQYYLPDHWGAYYSTFTGPPLHRLTDQTAINNNRNVSCAGFVKQNSTDSCDEFPFASTHEGAAIVGRARTGVGHVPLSDNTRAGTLLAAEYQNDRIIEGDNFWVIIGG